MDCFLNVPDDIKKFVQEAPDADEAIKQLKIENARKRKNTFMSKQKQVELFQLLDEHPNGPDVALDAILQNDLYGKAKNVSIYYKQRALQGYVESFLPELKEKLSTTKLGFSRDKDLGRDFVRAVMGEDSSEIAKRLAKEWENGSEWLRARYNKFGGKIGKLDYGYIPQAHDRTAVQKAGKDAWVSYIKPLLKNSDELNLDYIYDTIATGGLNKLKEGSLGKGKSIANKNAEERVMHFKDADSWIAYQEQFGNVDPLAAIDNHVRKLTTDLSLMEILGPNPTHMYETLKVKIKKDLGQKKGKKFMSSLEGAWEVVNGAVDQDLDGIGKLATALQTGRAINTATLLGSATLSALTDQASLFVNTVYHGMSPLKVMGKFIKNFKISNQQDAIRMGLGADVFNSEVTKRFSELGEGFWAKASEAIMRGTFMNIWTEAARKAFQTEYMHKLLNGRALSDLSVDEHINMLAKIQEETDYAVLIPTPRVRAFTTGSVPKGTLKGEIVRSTSQFSSFTLTFMQQHGARMLMQGTKGSKIAYGSSLIALSTILGGFAIIAKDAARGYNPREGFNIFDKDVDTEQKIKFWKAAALQGGGLGIFGDFLFSDQNRFGKSLGTTVGGPTAQLAQDTVKLTVGNIQQLAQGETTNFGSELIEFGQRHVNPAKAFYINLLVEKYITEPLKMFVDEEYERKKSKSERKRAREYGQEKFEWLQ